MMLFNVKGSKNYRYKGLLDRFANRAYSGTNAWTATDHTAYTLDTAGWDGFAQIVSFLPVLIYSRKLMTVFKTVTCIFGTYSSTNIDRQWMLY